MYRGTIQIHPSVRIMLPGDVLANKIVWEIQVNMMQ